MNRTARKTTKALNILGLCATLFAVSLPIFAQDKPFIVHDTKPVIMLGPYISSLSETGATIVWTTDTPCHAKVIFGLKGEALTREADNAVHGLLTIGTLHVIILDTGEDKADETNVYAQLNKVEAYRLEEFAWLKQHLETDKRAAEAVFRVILLHQPNWGWTRERGDQWTELANKGKVDLLLGGHYHQMRSVKPGTQGNNFTSLALGQDQIAKVEATRDELRVTVAGKDGVVAETLTIRARR